MLLVCSVCHDQGEESTPARCDRCGKAACGKCDRCGGCGRTVCAACDTEPTPEHVYPGDARPHPHVALDGGLR